MILIILDLSFTKVYVQCVSAYLLLDDCVFVNISYCRVRVLLFTKDINFVYSNIEAPCILLRYSIPFCKVHIVKSFSIKVIKKHAFIYANHNILQPLLMDAILDKKAI